MNIKLKRSSNHHQFWPRLARLSTGNGLAGHDVLNVRDQRFMPALSPARFGRWAFSPRAS